MRWLLPAVVVFVFGSSAGTATATAGALREHYFGARAERTQAMPGEKVEVGFFDRNYDDHVGLANIATCRIWFDGRPEVKCPGNGRQPSTAEVTVPEPRGPGLDVLHWEVTYWVVNVTAVVPDPVDSGVVPFTILQVGVTTDPAAAVPGKPLAVDLSTPAPEVQITGCVIRFVRTTGRCEGDPASDKRIEITVPDHVPQGGRRILRWELTYRYDRTNGAGSGRIPVTIALLPPKFEVSPSTAQPGLPLVVAFRSATTGVTITGCDVIYQRRASCSPARTAVVLIPPDARVGSTLTIPWSISYDSTRTGEKPGTTGGSLDVPVVAERVRFTVTAQPGKGAPRDEVTLTITPVIPGISIDGCIAFFPNDTGDRCQATDERWFVRTRVPAGTPPGATLLRWGVASVDEAGTAHADNGVLPFEVLRPSDTRIAPDPPPRQPSRLPPTTLPPAEPTTTTTESPATFVARTDPEAAGPGSAVRVAISALTPGTAITGCRAAFSGERVVPCDDSGGRWTATLTVPEDAEAGDLPLLWDAASRSGADKGTIAYRVLGAGGTPQPQFGVVVQPASVRAGEHVMVTHHTYDNGPAITGCSAGIAPGGVLAACTETTGGWVADVVVPKEAPPGTAVLVWQTTYASGEGGGTATADGRANVGVLDAPAEEAQSWWQKVWGLILRAAAVALLGAALIGGRFLYRRVFGDRPKTAAGDEAVPDDVAVRAVLPAGVPPVAVSQPDTPQRRLIRLVVRRPPARIRIRIREESP